MKKVSVIIPSYNSGRFLAYAIDSVMAQTFRSFQIIIVNDGSTDCTENVVNDYKKKYKSKIHYYYQKNAGLASARNKALKNSKSEYVALLDADDIWLPERLSETVTALENDKNAGIAHGGITRIKENGEIIDSLLQVEKYVSGKIFENIFLRRAHLASPTVLFRRSCVEQVGLFDENLSFLGCEDRELWLRIAKHFSVKYVNKVVAKYRITQYSLSKNIDKMHRARLYIVDKYCPPSSKLALDRRLRRLALAKIYRDRGDEFLINGNYAEARKNYEISIKQNPVSFWPWINLIKSYRKCDPNNIGLRK